MAQGRQYPTFHDADGVLDLGFISRFVGAARQHCDAVVLRHLVISAIEIRLVAACSSNARTRIIRHEQPCNALEELEGSDMAVNPARQVLAVRSSSKGVCAGAEHGDKD